MPKYAGRILGGDDGSNLILDAATIQKRSHNTQIAGNWKIYESKAIQLPNKPQCLLIYLYLMDGYDHRKEGMNFKVDKSKLLQARIWYHPKTERIPQKNDVLVIQDKKAIIKQFNGLNLIHINYKHVQYININDYQFENDLDEAYTMNINNYIRDMLSDIDTKFDYVYNTTDNSIIIGLPNTDYHVLLHRHNETTPKNICRNLSREKKELATFGYIRQNSIHSVPIPISKLCLNYFDEKFYISISGNLLKKFIKMKHGEFIEKIFKYGHDISFCCRLYPNGGSGCVEENGSTMFCVVALFDEYKIESVKYRFEMECKHTNSHFIGYHSSDISVADGWVDWTYCCQKLCEYENDETLRNLIFSIGVDINCIQYTNGMNWTEPFTVDMNYLFQWKLDKMLKRKIKDYSVGKYVVCEVSDDECWVMNLYPHGFSSYDNGKPCIAINFLKWCHDIKRICGRYKICVTNPSSNQEGNWEINDMEYGMFITVNSNPFESEMVSEFKVEIKITKIVDLSNN